VPIHFELPFLSGKSTGVQSGTPPADPEVVTAPLRVPPPAEAERRDSLWLSVGAEGRPGTARMEIKSSNSKKNEAAEPPPVDSKE